MREDKREEYRKNRPPAIVMLVILGILMALIAGYAVEMVLHGFQPILSSAAPSR